ncbi:MAG: hypothetical protein ACI80K_004906 [Paracoccaceae bacterium]|jgi:hypothetical protein
MRLPHPSGSLSRSWSTAATRSRESGSASCRHAVTVPQQASGDRAVAPRASADVSRSAGAGVSATRPGGTAASGWEGAARRRHRGGRWRWCMNAPPRVPSDGLPGEFNVHRAPWAHEVTRPPGVQDPAPREQARSIWSSTAAASRLSARGSRLWPSMVGADDVAGGHTTLALMRRVRSSRWSSRTAASMTEPRPSGLSRLEAVPFVGSSAAAYTHAVKALGKQRRPSRAMC